MPSKASTVVSAAKGIKWFLTPGGKITIIFSIVIIIHAVTSGITEYNKTKNPSDLVMPFLWEVGGRLLSADEYVYQTVEKLKYDPDSLVRERTDGIGNLLGRVWDKIYIFYDLFCNVWFIILNFKIHFWIWLKINNDSEKLRNAVFAIMSMAVIQILFSSTFLIAQMARGQLQLIIPNMQSIPPFSLMAKILLRVLPFKGIVDLALFFPTLINGIYDKFLPYSNPVTEEKIAEALNR